MSFPPFQRNILWSDDVPFTHNLNIYAFYRHNLKVIFFRLLVETFILVVIILTQFSEDIIFIYTII